MALGIRFELMEQVTPFGSLANCWNRPLSQPSNKNALHDEQPDNFWILPSSVISPVDLTLFLSNNTIKWSGLTIPTRADGDCFITRTQLNSLDYSSTEIGVNLVFSLSSKMPFDFDTRPLVANELKVALTD